VETYLTTEEVAAYFKVKEQSVRRWVMNNEIPHRKINGVLRYRLSELERWVEEGGGYSLSAMLQARFESDLFEDSISLDELAELELAEEEKEDEE